MSESNTQIAIVTGAAGGIGLAIAARLVSRNVTAICFDLKPCPLDTVKSCVVDLTASADVRRLVGEITATIGTPDLLVNNAALAGRGAECGLIAPGAADHFERLLSANVAAPFLLLSLFAQRLIQSGKPGRVVNIASAAAYRGGKDVVGYSASKAAVIGLSRAAAVELAPHRIAVNSISPGFVATAAAVSEYPLTEAELAVVNPLGRTAEPDEIAKLAEFLLLDAPDFLTGADHRIDGGSTIA